MKAGPAIAEGEEPLRSRRGPSQYEHCKHPGCQHEVRFAWTAGYCLKHHLQHREESEIMEKKFTDEAIKAAVAKHPDNLKAARLELGMSDAGFAYRARKLGLMAPRQPKAKKRGGASTKKATPTQAQASAAPTLATMEASAPAPALATPKRPSSLVDLSPRREVAIGLEELEAEAVALGKIVEALRPLSARSRAILMARLGVETRMLVQDHAEAAG